MSDSAPSSPTPEPEVSRGGSSGSARAEGRAPIPSAENQPTVISSRAPGGSSSQRSTAVDIQAPARPPERIRSGTRLGDVELLDHIGGGGMGQVYRGQDRRLNRPVAVKVMSRQHASDADTVRRFLNEARSAARLNHRNIAQVFSAGDSDSRPFIVFEYVEGSNIRSIVEQRGPLPLEEALSYTLQIADALAHAAEMRIVHRDVKPSNILIDKRGQAKLIDFGLARLTEPSPPEGDLTASGVTLGTFDYISPEQARDPRNADTRSDIYSLGCTFFYMLVGRPPFPEGTVLQKLLQHQGDEPPDVCQFRSDLPDEAAQVLARMMAKDPRRRYPDSAHLLEGLLGLADLIGLHPTGPAHTVWLPPRESHISTLHRQLPWLAPATVFTCLVVLLHFLWSSQDEAADLAMQALPPTVAQAAPVRVQGSSANPPGDSSGGTGSGQTEGGTSGPSAAEAPSPIPGSEPRDASPATEAAVAAAESAAAADSTDAEAPKSAISGLINEASPPSSLGPEPLTARLASPTEFAGAITAARPTSDEGGLSAATKPPVADSAPESPLAVPIAAANAVIVAPNSQDPAHFGSIAAALAADPGASLIELRYNGRQSEKPVTLPGRQIAVRSGTGYQPVVAFHPSAADPVLCPREMIRVESGTVSLEGIALELDVPRNMPSEAWSLVRLSSSSTLRLRDCSLTIRNSTDDLKAYHQNVAFFRMVAAKAPSVGLAAPPKLIAPAKLDLANCIVRGEASLVRFGGEMPLAFTWDNGLLATTEPVLLSTGSDRAPAAGAAFQVGWTHVTIATGQDLIRLAVDEYRPHVAPIAISESACVVSCPAKPLIHICGSLDPLPLLAKIRWQGRDSLVEAAPARVVIDPTGIRSEDELIQLEALAAQETEAVGLPSAEGRIPWLQSPIPPRAVHAAQPSEFELSATDPAVQGANRDPAAVPGFVAARLPSLPVEPKPAASGGTGARPTAPAAGQTTPVDP
ncbi:MAG: protein kinase [Pirellulales bacterium]|nr:protein kinase [Pirellulales bacterium]